MITTSAPAAPTPWARIRRALTTACLVPVFLGALLLGLFEGRWTWPRALAFGAACEFAAIVLVVTR